MVSKLAQNNSAQSKVKGMSLSTVTAKKTDFIKEAFNFGQGPMEELIPDEPQEEEKQEFNALTENVLISVNERVDCSISKFGDINKFEVIGTVNFTTTDPAKTNVAVKLNLSNFGSKLKFRIPPDFDKQAWAKEKIFKSSGEGFKP